MGRDGETEGGGAERERASERALRTSGPQGPPRGADMEDPRRRLVPSRWDLSPAETCLSSPFFRFCFFQDGNIFAVFLAGRHVGVLRCPPPQGRCHHFEGVSGAFCHIETEMAAGEETWFFLQKREQYSFLNRSSPWADGSFFVTPVRCPFL